MYVVGVVNASGSVSPAMLSREVSRGMPTLKQPFLHKTQTYMGRQAQVVRVLTDN